MRGRFEFQKLAKYPHMRPEDVAVWERFIEKNPLYFDRVDYDVPCGKGEPQDASLPENIQRDGTILTQKKIDAVAYKLNEPYVIEIGPIANMRKLGQILTYRMLYTADHPDETKLHAMVICGDIERELEEIYTRNGIELKTA